MKKEYIQVEKNMDEETKNKIRKENLKTLLFNLNIQEEVGKEKIEKNIFKSTNSIRIKG